MNLRRNKKLKEGIFHNIRPKIINIDKQKMKIVPQKIVTYKGYRIYSILTLMDPYFCIYRTTEEKTGKLFFQDSNVEFIKEIGIDWNTDTYDAGLHLNVDGAEKASVWFGKVLAENCGVPDRRNDEMIAALWSDKAVSYYEQKRSLENETN